MTSDTMLFQSTPSTILLMLLSFSVELCPPKNDGLQLVSVIIKHNQHHQSNKQQARLTALIPKQHRWVSITDSVSNQSFAIKTTSRVITYSPFPTNQRIFHIYRKTSRIIFNHNFQHHHLFVVYTMAVILNDS